MTTDERFDDLLTQRLRADAPREAPGGLLDTAMNRIANTPQRGRGWLRGPATILAAAAVLLLAVLAGTQLAGLIGRPAGTDPSPSASVVPTESAEPSATVAPSASATAQPTASPIADDGLVLRVVTVGGPTSPASVLPTVTLMADGALIWQPIPQGFETTSLLTRTLTVQGLADLRAHIFGSGLLDASATHELEQRPDAPEPLGRGVSVHTFTAGDGDDQVVVSSVQWLGDEEEATYYQPSPERQQLDELAQELRDPESLVGADAWAGPVEPYHGANYQLVFLPNRDVPPYDTADAALIPLPFDGPLDEFGEASGQARPPVLRCGVVSRDEAAQIVGALAALDDASAVIDFGEVGLDRTTFASLDWAEGNGTIDVYLIPRMPDAFPECTDQG